MSSGTRFEYELFEMKGTWERLLYLQKKIECIKLEYEEEVVI